MAKKQLLQLLVVGSVGLLLFADLVKDFGKGTTTVAEIPKPVQAPASPLKVAPSVEPATKPPGSYLGAIVDKNTLIIQIIEPESAAEKAGLNAGDRLTQINGKPLHSFAELKVFLDRKPKTATFTVLRLIDKPSKPEKITVIFDAKR